MSTGPTKQPHSGRVFRTWDARSSLNRPDLYAFVGGSITAISGIGAALFRAGVPDLNGILALAVGGIQPLAVFGGLQVGLELKMHNRISIAAMLITTMQPMKSRSSTSVCV